MKAQRQRIRHDPARRQWGDCHRAALASILGLPMSAVPHFADGGPSREEFQFRVEGWLAERNMTTITMPLVGQLSEVLSGLGACSASSYWILGGRSRTGVPHVVVGLAGHVIHDPALDWPGAHLSPMDDGCYWVTFLVVRHPYMELAPSAPGRRRFQDYLLDLLDLARLTCWGIAQAVGWSPATFGDL